MAKLRTLTALFLLLALACTDRVPSPNVPSPVTAATPNATPTPLDNSCASPLRDHAIFSIAVDGIDVGREVRSIQQESGPFGLEQIIYSHLFFRMRFRDTLFETREVRVQRTVRESGLLLRASHVIQDQIKSQTFLVGYNGANWDRLTESRAFFASPEPGNVANLALTGNEVVGLRLLDHLRHLSQNPPAQSVQISYYEPLLDHPVEVVIHVPVVDTVLFQGQAVDGVWITAKEHHSDRVLMKTFFDKHGSLWIEEYPELRQVKRRLESPYALTSDTSELMIGFHSNAYIADPNSATRATFLLSATPARLDALELLGEPENHTLSRRAPNELILEVLAAAPDGDDPPTDSDLGSSKYIKPASREIVRALRYLRSAGKRGSLTKIRRFNATSIIARASLIERPSQFWSDPDKVAGLVMHYVSSLLPNKNHTFTISDAPTILENGGGDCTEHAVLFASLMRAHNIPTRLVTGMRLTPGGVWAFHMWNTYWNGMSWRSIDPSTMSYRTGALYVALGRGSSSYTAVHNRLSDFMRRTFSGISFDLISASNNGETLFLARPAHPDGEMAYLNALVLSSRGNHQSALSVLDEHISPANRSPSVHILRIELLVRSGQYDKALHRIALMREETSSRERLDVLDGLEFESLLSVKRFTDAEQVLRRIEQQAANHKGTFLPTRLEAKLLFARGDVQQALDLLEQALASSPRNAALLALFADLVATSSARHNTALLHRALDAASAAARETLFADHRALTTLSRVLKSAQRIPEARLLLDHALVLAPAERSILMLRQELEDAACVDPP